MEKESEILSYYSWMDAILKDYLEPYDTLMEILSNNPSLQDRVNFLRYLNNEYEMGVIPKLLKQIHGEDTIYDESYYTNDELSDYSPKDRAYLLQCRVLDKVESLFNKAIPVLLKKCLQMANELKRNSSSNAAPCFDEEEVYLTTQEAASFLGLEKSTIYRYVHEKKLTPISAGGKVNKFKKSDLMKMYKFKSYRNEELEKELEKEYQRSKKSNF
jgi:excisionase family DNA binding protein